MILALIRNGVVAQVVTANSDEEVNAYSVSADAAIDITNMNPQPVVGWLFDGVRLTGPAVSMKITKLAMLQRFTVPERLGILTYVNANPASVPALLVQNIMVATFVDLLRPDTIAGINYLVSFGLLTSDRPAVILTTPPTQLENYIP